MISKKFSIFVLCLISVLLLNSCSSYKKFQYETDEFEIPSKVFKSDYDQTWQAALKVMKSYDLEVTNQKTGVIKTRWIDNTSQLNDINSFGSSDSIKAAKFNLIINVVKGFRGEKEVSKVTVFRRQMIEQEFLQGWNIIRSDGIIEKLIVYRIDRELKINNQLKRVEEQKTKDVKSNL